MFQVKVTVIDFKGDTKSYPCHFGNKIGDEIVFDGEIFIGRVCPMVLSLLMPRVTAVFAAGPRYIDPAFYMPLWYSIPSVRDLSFKKYDGMGWKAIKEYVEPQDAYLAKRLDARTRRYPPHGKREIKKDIIFTCDDFKTGTTFKLEAFDLAEKGLAIPYFRKQMLILSKVITKPGIQVEKITGEFPKEQIEDIYPGLFPVMFEVLTEELMLVNYLEIRNEKAFATEKGKAKLTDFTTSLSVEEREVLGI